MLGKLVGNLAAIRNTARLSHIPGRKLQALRCTIAYTPFIRNRWIGAFAFILVLLGACTVTDARTTANFPLDCSPIDPLAKELPATPCFRATLSNSNEVALEWRVINSHSPVYIANQSGHTGSEVGYKPADCPTDPGGLCTARLKVAQGGLYRWQLIVKHDSGQSIHVPTALDVPPLFPPAETKGSGFVDMFAPQERTISWVADYRNAPLQQSIESAWIEMRPPGSFFWHWWQPLARSGPAATFKVPAAALDKPGRVNYNIRDCKLPTGSDAKFCSGPISIGFLIGSDYFLGPRPLYSKRGTDLEIFFTNASGDERRLSSATLMPLQSEAGYVSTTSNSFTIDSALLTPGSHKLELVSCSNKTNSCSPPDRITILVDAHVHWEQNRDYRKDFDAGKAYAIVGSGEPLDITYDDSGGIWMINEFANSVEHVTPEGVVESFTVPLARSSASASNTNSFKEATPFALSLTGVRSVAASISMLGEVARWDGSRVWFTQGGGMLPDTGLEHNNHSRIISFDPSNTDLLVTPYDDRLCVYNVPADDPGRLGNNQVIGLTTTADRIWIGESRGLFGEEPSAISSFTPNPDSCENLLDFGNPTALARQKLPYCLSEQTPEQDACIEKISLQGLPPKLKVAHLATDPIDETIWFTDPRGKYLGNLDLNRAQRIELLPLPASDANQGIPGFGGFPWTLRVDKNAVYIAEYSSRKLLRLDKKSGTFDEIYIPVANQEVALHSIDIDYKNNRLWFTLANELTIPLSQTASTIGYIDLNSWRDYVTDPSLKQPVRGVIYKGLEHIPPSNRFNDRHQAFRGITVDPDTGKIALATMWRRQITELTPKSRFRPWR